MANTQLLQILQSANARIKSDFLNRTAKAVWQTVSAPIKALRAIGEDPSAPPSAVFLGDAFVPSADGASANVTLRRGLAVQVDGSIGDAWDGDVKPMYADADQTVGFTQNTDASGDDRIDLVVMRPVIEEEDPQSITFKDTINGPTYVQTVDTRRSLVFEIDVLEGTPAPSPTPPATPSGWTAVCEVTRPNGQANVFAADVNDVRVLDTLRAGTLAAVKKVLVGDPAGAHYLLQRDSETSPTLLQLRDELGAEADIDAGEVYGDTQLSARDTLRFGDRAVADADRLHLESESALSPDFLRVRKGDGTTWGRIEHATSVQGWALLRFDANIGDGSWAVDNDGGVLDGAVVTDNAVGDWTLSVPGGTPGSVVQVTNANAPGGLFYTGIISGGAIDIGVFDSADTRTDPAAGTRIVVTTIGLV